MSKEQTPITADYIKKEILKGLSEVFRGKTIYMKDIEVSIEQYAQAKVLEALEREVIKIAQDLQYQMFIITSNPTTVGDLEYLKIEAFNRSKDYYETEVKPKYKTNE